MFKWYLNFTDELLDIQNSCQKTIALMAWALFHGLTGALLLAGLGILAIYLNHVYL